MTTLVIVESPAKGKKIESYLGSKYKVMATKGHIADLAKGGPYNLGVDIDNGFKPRYQLLDDKVQLVNELFEAASESDEILIASDPDREGEAIAWHVASKLAKTGKDIKRVEFHEITKNGIAEGIKKSRDLDLKLFRSQEARRVLDRIVGFMASPFLMNFFGSNLSAGRVQSVVTKMIIDREQEIEAFVPETFYVLKANLTKDGKTSFQAKLDERITDEQLAQDTKALLIGDRGKNNAQYVVTEVLADEELKKPNAPMITSQLQKVMSKSFGMNPDATMKAAQSLYENGHVTYIRTDSVRADPDAVKTLRDFLKAEGFALPKTANVYKTKDTAQDAHECIRPTDLSLKPSTSGFTGDEEKVYEVIWKYFVASQMLPAVYNTLKVTIELKSGNKCVLKASGKALKSQGFLEIMGVTDDSKIEIPDLSVGDILTLHGKNPVSLEKKATQPPPRFSNFSLIEVLEKKNIGRPATFADVLSKITNRNYVEMEGTTYRPTPLGRQTTEALAKFFSFMEYNYSAQLEEKLDDIKAGKLNYLDMLHEFFTPFKTELDKAYIHNGSEVCELCHSPMKVRMTKNEEKFLGCSNYPTCRFTKDIK